MEPGNIVEFIDKKKIVCAVVLKVKDQKAGLLTKNGREFSVTLKRIIHVSNDGNDKLINAFFFRHRNYLEL